MHPFVSGELACGNLANRNTILSLLNDLPAAKVATNAEALQLLEYQKIIGKGLGWIDVHLLASALLSHGQFWTLDKKLGSVAKTLGIENNTSCLLSKLGRNIL